MSIKGGVGVGKRRSRVGVFFVVGIVCIKVYRIRRECEVFEFGNGVYYFEM